MSEEEPPKPPAKRSTYRPIKGWYNYDVCPKQKHAIGELLLSYYTDRELDFTNDIHMEQATKVVITTMQKTHRAWEGLTPELQVQTTVKYSNLFDYVKEHFKKRYGTTPSHATGASPGTNVFKQPPVI